MTQHDLPGMTVASVRKTVRPAPRPPAVPYRPSPATTRGVCQTAVATTAVTTTDGVVTRKKVPAGTLIAAVVLQAGQALLWMFVGLIMTIGNGGAHTSGANSVGAPVAVVLVIAAILAFAIGGFVLALAAGTLGRSDVCRIASVIFQFVFGALILVGSVEVIHAHSGAGFAVSLDPATGHPAFLVTPGFIVVLLASCIAVVTLLLCRTSSWATRVRYRRRYR